ncbi:MAG TPA: GNAT family N-acetyltransferase [Acidimicrobiales bacterium]
MLDAVNWRIRKYRPSDEEPVVVLSLRAWAPVFASLEEMLGVEIFRRLHSDWRVDQDKAVRGVLVDPAMEIWITEDESGPTGFVAAKLNVDSLIGEVYMLAVDPDAQDEGVGSALTETATNWLRTSRMRVAMIDTGGDPSHAPARRVYEKANYTTLPIARYFKAL